MRNLFALLCGGLFGAGLVASGMTDRHKVIGFLDIFGDWQADLLFVMASAVITTLILFRLALKRQRPLYASKFVLPGKTKIDSKLILGAVLFGLGWGLYGYCPGPAVTALIYLQPETFMFCFSMMIGMFLGARFIRSK